MPDLINVEPLSVCGEGGSRRHWQNVAEVVRLRRILYQWGETPLVMLKATGTRTGGGRRKGQRNLSLRLPARIVYGVLTVVKVERRDNRTLWVCSCRCGAHALILASHVRAGQRSCGRRCSYHRRACAQNASKRQSAVE